MVNIKDLGIINTGENRQVRESISTPTGIIEVYEPTIEDITEIINLQKEEDMKRGIVDFSGEDVIRNLFPLLTNIDFGDITDEELQEIIENPSVHLLTAQQIVAQIVTEANKLYFERMKTEIMNADSTMTQMELLAKLPQMIIDKAKENGEGKVYELAKKMEEVGKELDEALEREGLNDLEENVDESKETEEKEVE